MSDIEAEFLRVLADSHKRTADRITRRICEKTDPSRIAEIVHEEIRGLMHGTLVVLDNGSSLADFGMIQIVDEAGEQFSPGLHERLGEHYDT